MDPYAHTIIAMSLMFISHIIGKKVGRREGISSTVNYLIEMEALTEESLKIANDKFQKFQEDSDGEY